MTSPFEEQRLTRREAATIVAALYYYQAHAIDVLTRVRMPDEMSGEVPLSQDEVRALVVRLLNGELQE
jgi:hypothetical protein